MSARSLTVVVLLVSLGPAARADATVRHVFVTSASGSGDLFSWPTAGTASTPLEAGDNICQSLASAAALANPGDYRVWLSTPSNDAYCHVQDLSGQRSSDCGGQASLPGAGPWKRLDGNHFAADLDHLLDPDYEVYLPPRLDENQATVHSEIWTGTTASGEYAGNGCEGVSTAWSSASSQKNGERGLTDGTGSAWTDGVVASCDSSLHLLCFQTGTGDPLGLPANWGRLAFVTSATGSGDLSFLAAVGWLVWARRWQRDLSQPGQRRRAAQRFELQGLALQRQQRCEGSLQ